jgi:hypothetical protein
MKNIPPIVLLAAAITVYLIADTIRVLRTGKTPGLFHKHLRHRQRTGPVTRKGRPRLFWGYVIGNAIILLLCFGYLSWVLFSRI